GRRHARRTFRLPRPRQHTTGTCVSSTLSPWEYHIKVLPRPNRRLRPASPCRRTQACAFASPSKARADTDRFLVAAEGTAEGDRCPLAERALVSDRQCALAALEPDADADPVLGADAGGAGRHVQHCRAHRPLAV